MCRQETALEILKSQKNKGGLSSGQIKLTEAQIADFKEQNVRHEKDMEKIQARMTNIEKKVDSLDKKVDAVDEKLDKVSEALGKEKCPFVESLKTILSNKVFLYLLVTVMCAAFGISVGEVGTFLFQ